MITTARPRIGMPIVPRNKADPTQSYRAVNKMFRDIESRYLGIKTALRSLFDQRLVGRESASNAQATHAMHGGTIYQVNAGAFIYDMTAQQLADLLERVQVILDDYLLEGIGQDIWALTYIAEEYQRGTLNAYTNLSAQSPIYESQTTLVQLLSSPAYQNQIGAAYVSAYSDWKGVSDKARADLANVIADAIGRGINPRETARIVSKRLDVSMASAKNIAQTEQVGALREAQWNETDWSKERLGLNTGLLHLSALKPTTRQSHAFWHGRVRTVAEVRDWYSINGNKYHCYCSQIPVILNDKGEIANEGLSDRLAKERKDWQKAE